MMRSARSAGDEREDAMRRCCDARRADAPSGSPETQSEETEATPHTSGPIPDDNRTIRVDTVGRRDWPAGASREAGVRQAPPSVTATLWRQKNVVEASGTWNHDRRPDARRLFRQRRQNDRAERRLTGSGATDGANGDDTEMSGSTQIVRGPAPPIFPAGAQFAVVEGDPSKAGDSLLSGFAFPTAMSCRLTPTRPTNT